MPPESQHWPADRALLMVHGVGNAKPGDYDDLVAQVKSILASQPTTLLGGAPKPYAIYFLYYDQINDAIASKIQAPLLIESAVSAIRSKLDATSLANTISEFAGDVVWPILVADARDAVRTSLIQQLQQIVKDGRDSGIPARKQHLSIITHSLGCFHVFEALHAITNDTRSGLTPGMDAVAFDNVIFMASPVQLIRSVAEKIVGGIPQSGNLRCLAPGGLAMPQQVLGPGKVFDCARRTVSITGDLDPVGGYFFRKRLDWAYMNLNLSPDNALIDDEQPLNVSNEDDLEKLLAASLANGQTPTISIQNPHDWSAYVDRHGPALQSWLNI